ncbi:MAG: Ig-like domain-containing protein [Planctomycetota bacterium]
MIGDPGEELEKPGGGTFFNEQHEGGEASALHLLEAVWGRLVDVHDVDAAGQPSAAPVFRDLVIEEGVQSDGQAYTLETNPASLRTRLVIHRTQGAPDDGAGTFADLLAQARDDLSPILPKGDSPGILPPFSFVARNAALSLRFSDLLRDDAGEAELLAQHVRLKTNYPPTVPYTSYRALFDPNHGGLVATGGGEEFHSTRVILDLTVSEAEAVGGATGAVNTLGLPPSLTTTDQANVSLRLASEAAPSAGVFSVLSNLSGSSLTTDGAGPVDLDSPTVDLVRAMRSGNPEDVNNGFLLDLDRPVLLGGWAATLDAVLDDPAGEAGFEFVAQLTFQTPCRAQPAVGDVLELPGAFLEVTLPGAPPDAGGTVLDLHLRSLAEAPLGASALVGAGLYQRPYESGLLADDLAGCWLSLDPPPGQAPASEVAPGSRVTLRFSEPMDPASVLPFDTFLLSRTDVEPEPDDLVVGEVRHSPDARVFDFLPLLPLAHTFGNAERYYAQLAGDGVRDLAGNTPPALPELIGIELDPSAASELNGGVVLRFRSLDELVAPDAAAGKNDFAGQYLFDAERELIRPRPVVRSSMSADSSNAVPAAMFAFPFGVQTPLSPLGSRMMTVWRHFDLGMSATDPAGYNLDVEGLSWSPLSTGVAADYYEDFEIRLGHSHYLPDEAPGALAKPSSGLTESTFDANYHPDAAAARIVHPRQKGYTVNPSDLYVGASGTFLMPFPLNRDPDPAEHVYFTWRDTGIRERGAPLSNGIDTGVEEVVGLVPAGATGGLAPPLQVPTVGLPLLMEFRCYPSEDGIGQNAFNISLAVIGSNKPNFRVFSTGGLDQTGILVQKDPDLEDTPSGGFNPMAGGVETPAGDNSFYVGQLDVITRVSRVHSVWIDTGFSGTAFLEPVLEPLGELQPQGTELLVAWRGASAIGGDGAADFAFDAAHLDPYGDLRMDAGMPAAPVFLGSNGDVTFVPPGDESWKDSLAEVDGARFLQARLTFVSNAVTLLTPELSSLGVAFTFD